MKRHLGSLATVLVFGASVLGLGIMARAQQAPPDSQQPMDAQAQYPAQQGDAQQQAPNDQGAARVSYIQGALSTQHNNSTEWDAATVNTPVVVGDHISTDKGSRAEIQLDFANTLRMSDESTANVVNLSPSQIQLQIGQGLVNFDVLKGSEAQVEIDTPNVAIRPQMAEGSYRILVNSDGETIVDVRKGSAEISTPQGSTRVDRNQRITIQGNADSAQYQVSGAPGRDDWDKWNSDRDNVIESAASWQHTNPYYTGTQDLDPYGHWNDVPDYGPVWFPAADTGWAPYRDGRWVFEPYYGWTWVSYEPWGWAPYHYGRWFVYGGNWGWWPGPVYGGYRPLWAPAYVSFFGFGSGGFGVGFGFGGGFGNIGWLPCGPGDRFYPWYGRGVNRVNVVNIYNVHNEHGGFGPLRGGPHAYSNIDRAFNDEHVRGGISSMRGDQFGRGRVPQQQQRFDAGSLRQASVMTGASPVSPSRESFRPSDRHVSPGAIPNRAVTNQRFFSSARQSGAANSDRGQAGFNRVGNPGGNSIGNQPQQNSERPGFRSFGSGNSGNSNQGSRQGNFNPGGVQPQQQQNGPRPGSEQSGQSSRGFSSGNSGNTNRGPASEQTVRPPQENTRGQRGSTPPSPQQGPQNQSARPDWRTFTPSTRESQPNGSGRTYEGQGNPQPRYNENNQTQRPSYSRPAESQPQYQNNSRGSSGNAGYSRPPLIMQQPVVTPRSRSYSAPSAPPTRSAPSSGSSGGGYRGGSSGGGSRSNNSGGGHSSSGHDRR